MKRTSHTLPTLCLFGLCLVQLIWAPALLAQIDTRLSRSTTSLDEPVQLQLQIKGENNASPDLSVLEEDFEILSRSASQNVSIINGHTSKTRGLTLSLLPKRAGDLSIPSIPVGDEQSEPLAITVVENLPDSQGQANSKTAFFQLELSKTKAYLQEEVILTVRLYQSKGVRSESIGEPQASQSDTLLQPIGVEQYQAKQDGELYRVIERRYAVFANQPGKLQLGKIRFRGRSGLNDPPSISNLMPDPFNLPRGDNRVIRSTSEQVEVEVLPTPSQFSGQHWLPAKDLQIIDNTSNYNQPLVAGRPIRRTIGIFANGLTSAQLPDLNFEVPVGFKQYTEKPQTKDKFNRDGVFGSRQIGITLVAIQPGSYTLPTVEIPWWNTQTDQQEVARLPAVKLQVHANLGTATKYPKSYARGREEVAHVNPAPPVEQLAADDKNQDSGLSVGLIWIVGIGSVVSLVGWWWLNHRRKPHVELTKTEEPISEQPKDDARNILDALEAAYQQTDPEAARAAWLRWGQLQWPEHPPSNLNRLARRCSHNVALAVTLLDRTFYTPGASDNWQEINPRELLVSVVENNEARANTEGEINATQPVNHHHKGLTSFVCRPSCEDKPPALPACSVPHKRAI